MSETTPQTPPALTTQSTSDTGQETTTTPAPDLSSVTPGQAAMAVEHAILPDQNDVMNLSPQQRVEYILDVRRRIQADPQSVSDDEIRNAVRLIRISRSDAGRSRKAGKKVVPVVGLSDF